MRSRVSSLVFIILLAVFIGLIDNGKCESAPTKLGWCEDNKQHYFKCIEFYNKNVNDQKVPEGFESNWDSIIYTFTLRDNTPDKSTVILKIYRPNIGNKLHSASLPLATRTYDFSSAETSHDIEIDLRDIPVNKSNELLGALINDIELISNDKALDKIRFFGPVININYDRTLIQKDDGQNITNFSLEMAAIRSPLDIDLCVEYKGDLIGSSTKTYSSNGKWGWLNWNTFNYIFGDIPKDWTQPGVPWDIYPTCAKK